MKRMFSSDVLESDCFMDLPASAQMLYIHMSLNSDNDGFVSRPKMIARGCGAAFEDLDKLIEYGFVILFDSGVAVITHWHVNNNVRKELRGKTTFKKERSLLRIDENGVYVIEESCCEHADNMLPTCSKHAGSMPNIIYNTILECNIEKDNIKKETHILADMSKEKNPPSCTKHEKVSKPKKKSYGEFKNVLLTDEETEKLKHLFPSDLDERIARLDEYIENSGRKYKNHYLTIKTWARKDGYDLKNPLKISDSRGQPGDFLTQDEINAMWRGEIS